MTRLFIAAATLTLIACPAFSAPTASAVRLGQAPTIDGNVRSDRAWRDVVAVSNFTQQQPREGSPASQTTQVFIGFTDASLYIAIVCHDENPEGIIVSSKNRDSNLSNEDSFRMVIDTYGTGQDGLVFGTNPTGVEYDGQVSTESGSRFSGAGFDLNWDTSWRVEAAIGDFGWSAEMEIPFTSLRYGEKDIQTWGFNFQRTTRRTNEVVYWAPLPRQYSLNRLTLAGTISGIEIPSRRNFTVTPYALGKTTRPEDTHEQEFGFDVKYSITPSLTLDATYNTDFAQVEVDQQQVNLNRFSLFFPEKRPFFQENASQFEVGTNNLRLFFSRRIGIGPDGQPIPIEGGLRVSGKVRGDTNLGLLVMRSKAAPGVTPETDFAVVRLKQDLANRSTIGVLIVDRDDGVTDNQTYAVDGRWGVGEKITLSGFAAGTQTAGISNDEHAYHLSAEYNASDWAFRGHLTEVGQGFNPQVGFLNRRGYRNIEVFGLRSIRPRSATSPVLEYRPHASYNGYWDFDGFHESGRLHLDHSMEWNSGASLAMVFNHIHEGVKAPFDISNGVTVPGGSYDDWEFHASASTNSSAALRGSFGITAGGFFGGDRLALSSVVTYRPNSAFETSVSWNYNDVELPAGNFDVGLTNVRMSYSFTPKMAVAALIQYDDRDEVLATNLRFSWLQSANAGLFVVYNETDDNLNAPGRPRREFIIKYSRILSVF